MRNWNETVKRNILFFKNMAMKAFECRYACWIMDLRGATHLSASHTVLTVFPAHSFPLGQSVTSAGAEI